MWNQSSAGRWLAWGRRPFALKVQRSLGVIADQGPVSDAADIRPAGANVLVQSEAGLAPHQCASAERPSHHGAPPPQLPLYTLARADNVYVNS